MMAPLPFGWIQKIKNSMALEPLKVPSDFPLG